MSDMDELDVEVREPRTAIFPSVAMPSSTAALIGFVLVGSAVVSVVSGVVQAIAYNVPAPIEPAGPTLPPLATMDRLELLTRGASGFSAVLVLLGAVFLVISGRSGEGQGRWRLAGLAAAGSVAAIVLLANVALCAGIVAKTRGTFTVEAVSNRFSFIVQLLGPISLGGAVLFYLFVHFTSETEPVEADA